RRQAGSAVDVPSMTYLDHVHLGGLVIDRVDDSIGSDAHSIEVIRSSQLLASVRSWLRAKFSNALDQARPVLLLVDGLDLLGGAALDEDAIASHASSTT